MEKQKKHFGNKFHPKVAEAVHDQENLGWQNFLEGCMSGKWREIQQRYYTWLGSRKTGLWWAVALIQKLWDVSWDQWEHWNAVLHDMRDKADDTDKLFVEDEIAWGFRIRHLDPNI